MRVALADAPSRGAQRPLVQLVVFSDFECSSCKHINPSLDRLLRTYPNDLRMAFRHNPDIVHPYAGMAAETAVAAYRNGGNNGFWHMHDLLFTHQQELSELDLRVHAVSVGLELEAFEEALTSGRHRGTVQRDQERAVALGVTASPTVFVNGRRIAGRQGYARYQRVVQEELRHAQRLLAAGVDRASLYETLMAGAVPPEPPPDQGDAGTDTR